MSIDFKAAREAMVRALRSEVSDERVLSAFDRVPRERFVPEEMRRHAYEDRALAIGYGQTISQPLMVAIMTQALSLRGDEKVLEVGTGSGYQTALLSLLAREVVSVERVTELAESAEERLQRLGYENVRVRVAGEELGWPQEAPYDAITVAAGAPTVPPSLLDQLADGGRLLIPVGGRRLQRLTRATKHRDEVTVEELGECRFVPLIAEEEGWPAHDESLNGTKPAF